jgi:hypothetical protein
VSPSVSPYSNTWLGCGLSFFLQPYSYLSISYICHPVDLCPSSYLVLFLITMWGCLWKKIKGANGIPVCGDTNGDMRRRHRSCSQGNAGVASAAVRLDFADDGSRHDFTTTSYLLIQRSKKPHLTVTSQQLFVIALHAPPRWRQTSPGFPLHRASLFIAPLLRGQHLLCARTQQPFFLPLHRTSCTPRASLAHGSATAFSTGPTVAFSTRAVSSASLASSTPINSMHRRASIPKQ